MSEYYVDPLPHMPIANANANPMPNMAPMANMPPMPNAHPPVFAAPFPKPHPVAVAPCGCHRPLTADAVLVLFILLVIVSRFCR